jgi:hypothetical protein
MKLSKRVDVLRAAGFGGRLESYQERVARSEVPDWLSHQFEADHLAEILKAANLKPEHGHFLVAMCWAFFDELGKAPPQKPKDTRKELADMRAAATRFLRRVQAASTEARDALIPCHQEELPSGEFKLEWDEDPFDVIEEQISAFISAIDAGEVSQGESGRAWTLRRHALRRLMVFVTEETAACPPDQLCILAQSVLEPALERRPQAQLDNYRWPELIKEVLGDV